MVNTYPLVTRDLNSPIAYLTKPINNFGLSAGPVETQTFLSHVNAVASQLADGKHAINLCENRYLFLVGFCAAILRGHTNLLPPNKNIATQQQISQAYSDCYIIHDGGDVAPTITSVDVSKLEFSKPLSPESSVPQIADQHLACVSFTSGSTGRSKPNLKYWRTLYSSTEINYRYMIPDADTTLFQLATMPAQHMWGLETSVLMPLFKRVCMSDAKPLFPHDILETLQRLPEPRLLVSTPVHLRALATNNSEQLSVFATLCATSPLTAELAQQVEQQFSSQLREVYGCSEVGSMAVRQTAREQSWLRFDGIVFDNDGSNTVASAAHLPEPTVLQDRIEAIDEQRFMLAGRTSDLVKIAGKRGSLFEINQVLLRFEGLGDGVVINPDSDNAVARLSAIVVLKEGFEKSTLIRFLREHLDSAFIPRPIYVVESLNREANGKLLKATVTELLESLRRCRT